MQAVGTVGAPWYLFEVLRLLQKLRFLLLRPPLVEGVPLALDDEHHVAQI